MLFQQSSSQLQQSSHVSLQVSSQVMLHERTLVMLSGHSCSCWREHHSAAPRRVFSSARDLE